MNTIKGTLIIMNDGEQIFVNHSKEEINNAIDQAIALKRNYITITHLDRDIYFNYIKNKFSKVKHLALPEPEKPKKLFQMSKSEQKELQSKNPNLYYEMSEKDKLNRIARDKILGDMLEKTYENRRINFLKERNLILKKLSKNEKRFNLETTIDKLEDLNNFRKIKLQEDAKKTLQGAK